eukprot:16955-Heterococcus_DN1.PRE.1
MQHHRKFDEFFSPAPSIDIYDNVSISRSQPTTTATASARSNTLADESRAKYLLRQRQLQIGYKPVTHGPPGLAQPLQKIPNSEGRDVFFQGYNGSWDSGHMSGYGIYTFAYDGTTYQGLMSNDLPNGAGRAVYSNGTTYQGDWKDGKHDGVGTALYSSGSVYTGAWKEGKRHGQGKVVYKSGASYVGDFYSGMYHGRGVYTSCPTTPFNKTSNNKQQQQQSVLDTTSADTDNTTTTSVVYDGRWEHGYIGGYGTLTIPAIGAGETLQRYKRDWPSVSRYGGGLSVRGAIDVVHREIETIHLEKLRDRDYLFGRSTMVELNYYVDTVRQNIADSRLLAKNALRDQRKKDRQDAKAKLLQMQMEEAMDAVSQREQQELDNDVALPLDDDNALLL